MNPSLMLTYLTALQENNNQDWFHAHKAEYKAAKAEFEALVQALIYRIGDFDGSVLHNAPADLTFKLMRDTRFSHDKSPYLPAFRAHIAAKGKLPVPVGYYLKLTPGTGSFLGGGLFADLFKDATAMVRAQIVQRGDDFDAIIHDPAFEQLFTVQGTQLKNVPAGFDKELPQAAYLKHKSWYLEYPLADSDWAADDSFLDRAAEVFRVMKPFNDFLNQALAAFEMPTR